MNKREDNIYFAKVFGGAALLIALLFLIFFLVGCTTQKKAVKYFNKHELVGADYCSVKHPCKDSVRETIRLIKGKPVITVHDSIIYSNDTNKVKKYVVKYVTKMVTKVDTLRYDRIIHQTDKAKEQLLQSQLSGISEQLKESKAKVNNRTKWALCGWLWVILLIIWQIVRKYFKF
jgi:hypothetical protein